MGNWSKLRTVLTVASLLIVIVCMQQTGLGQGSAAGSIQGTVTDSSGASLPGVTVTATASQTNQNRTMLTGNDGSYNLRDLAIGPYSIKAEKAGFSSQIIDKVEVSVGQAFIVNLQLAVGSATETVNVEATATPITEDKPDRALVLGAATLAKLPIQVAGGARLDDSFITLSPGVTGDTFSARINGAPDFTQDFYYDGIPYMNADGGGRQEGAQAPFESVDEYSIQTNAYSAQYGRGSSLLNFHIRSGANQPHGALYEYLRNNVLDAAGFFERGPHTEKQHEFGFRLGGPVYIPKLYNGKDKTFFYVNYDWYRFRGGSSNSLITLPTSAMRGGDFSALLVPSQTFGTNPCDGSTVIGGQIFDPATTQTVGGVTCRTAFPGNIIPTGRLSPLSAQFIGLIPPSGSQALTNNTLETLPSSPQNNLFYLFKADHNINHSLVLHGSYYKGNEATPTPSLFSGPLGNGNTFIIGFYEPRASLDWAISPHLLNQVLYSVQYTTGARFYLEAVPSSFTSPISTPGIPFPALNVQGMPSFGVGATNGGASGGCWPCTFFADNLKWVRGRHSLAFGTEIRFEDEKNTYALNTGTYNFGAGLTSLPSSANSGSLGFGFASFFLGAPNQVSRSGSTPVRLSKTGYRALYAQDDIKVTRKFTFNIGLRWDVSLPVSNKAGFYSTFDPTVPNPGAGGRLGSLVYAGNSGVGGCVPAGSSFCRLRLANTYYNNWQPRIGFAYKLTEKDVLRGGFGISTIRGGASTLMGPEIAASYLTGYQFQDTLSSPDNGFSVPVAISPRWDVGIPPVTPPPPRTLDLANGQPIQYMRPIDGKSGYVQMWSVTFEHQLPYHIALEGSYVGSSSVRIGANLLNVNQVPTQFLSLGPLLNEDINSPAAVAAGIPLPYSGFTGSVAQALRPFPQFQGISTNTQNTGHQSYNSLQVRAQKYFSDGLSFIASFTQSRTYSDSVDQFSTFGAGPPDTYNPGKEKSVLGGTLFNPASPRTFSLAPTYELPIGPGKRYLAGNGVVGKIVGGWGIAAVLTYNAGAPLHIFGGTPNPIFNGQERPNVVPGVNPYGHFSNPYSSLYLNPAAFSDPGAFALGNAPFAFNNIRGFHAYNENISFIKDTRVGEKLGTVQFRCDTFNIFNRTHFADPDLNWNDAVTGSFGKVTGQANSPRVVQFALRYDF